MEQAFDRTEMLLGSEAMQRLAAARVALFGVGGVGSYVAEALARSGIGTLDLFDSDTVAPSILNRQLIATRETLGMPKVEAARARILSINPAAQVGAHQVFYLPENADDYDLSVYDYIVDAVDTVSAKLELICRAKAAGVPIISCMGTGNKLDPTRLELADLYDTTVCPLARVMRRECRKRGIDSLRVLYSREEPRTPIGAEPGSRTPASIAFVPSAAGLIIAGAVVRELANVSL